MYSMNSESTLGPNQKPCPKCGDSMHRQSRQCRACYEKEHAKPEHYIARVCPICQTAFTVHKTHIDRGQGIYCSVSCARSGSPTHPRTRRQVECAICGQQFEKHLAEIKKNKDGLHFCSSVCWYKHNRGENHYLWDGGQNERVNANYVEWHKAVLGRDRFHCRICHARSKLEAHHIQRFATHPDRRWVVDNGLTLCHDCHIGFRHHEEEYEEMLSFVASVSVEVWNVESA